MSDALARVKVMTTAPADPPVLTVSGPGDLVSLVPYLVGFRPRRSLVVLSLRGPRLRCGLTARFDLPPLLDPMDLDRFVSEVVPYLLHDTPTQVALLVYDDEPWEPSQRPRQSLVKALEAAFEAVQVPVKEAVYVGAARYWSFTCESSRCCPDSGTDLADVRASEVAAEFVLRGRAPLDDRSDLVQMIVPRGPLTTAAVASVADRELDRFLQSPEDGALDFSRWQSTVLTMFDDLVARTEPAQAAVLTGDQAGLLVAGMLDIGIRDAIAERCSAWLGALPASRVSVAEPVRPPAYDQDPVTAVLLELAVMSDGPLAVAPLTLLAAQYWAAGEGALANAAVERALEIDPDYRLAVLLAQLLRAAIPPAWVEESRRSELTD